MKFFRSYYPTAGLKNNPNYLTKEKAETLCMGNAETLTKKYDILDLDQTSAYIPESLRFDLYVN